eukprot:2686475-Rhodomonas_salina.3
MKRSTSVHPPYVDERSYGIAYCYHCWHHTVEKYDCILINNACGTEMLCCSLHRGDHRRYQTQKPSY